MSEPSAGAKGPWWQRWRFAMLSLVTYAYFYQGADPNQHCRIFLTDAFLRGSVDITSEHGYTIDKAFFNERFLSDKAPGLSVLAMPVTLLMRFIDRCMGVGDSVEHQRAHLHFLTIVLCAVAGVVSTRWVGDLVDSYGASPRERGLSMVAYGFGTIVFPFSTVLFAHQLGAALVLACFFLARGKFLPESASLRTRAAVFGLVGSFAIVSEYPTAILVGVIAVDLLLRHRERWRDVVAGGVVGALPLLVLHSVYLRAAFGSPLSMPYGHVFEPFFKVHHGQGLLGVNLPSLAGIYGITVSPYRGLFFLCPHLVLAIFGLGYWIQSETAARDRRMICALLAAYFFFTAAYYAWDGGGSTGPRHFIPALGFLSVPWLAFIRRSAVHFWVGAGLTAVSVFIMFASSAVLIHQPEGEVLRSAPLYDVILPSLARGEIALNSQDIRTIGPRADAAYNLGMLAGLRGLASLVPLVAMWALAYATDLVRPIWRRRRLVETA